MPREPSPETSHSLPIFPSTAFMPRPRLPVSDGGVSFVLGQRVGEIARMECLQFSASTQQSSAQDGRPASSVLTRLVAGGQCMNQIGAGESIMSHMHLVLGVKTSM